MRVLDRIKQLDESMTKGEWVTHAPGDCCSVVFVNDGPVVAETFSRLTERFQNAQGIATLRNALPQIAALVAAAGRAAEAMDEMHAHCEDEGQCVDIRHSEERHNLYHALAALDGAL